MHMNTSEASNPQWERDTFAPRLKDAGYTTSYVGAVAIAPRRAAALGPLWRDTTTFAPR